MLQRMCSRGNGKSIESARRFFEQIKSNKNEFDVFYISKSDFSKLYADNKEMFEFNKITLEWYFKDTGILIFFREDLPKGVKGLLASSKYLKNIY